MDKLSAFVKEQIKGGANPAELKEHLISNGWKEPEVNSAISDAQTSHTKSRAFLVILGIVLVAALAFILISFAKNSQDQPSNPTLGNNNGEALQPANVAETCASSEDSIAKDECYKTLIGKGFDCETLLDSVENTYCSRAYEDSLLKGVERIDEG